MTKERGSVPRYDIVGEQESSAQSWTTPLAQVSARWPAELSRVVLVVDIFMVSAAVFITYLANFGLLQEFPVSGVRGMSYEAVAVIFGVTWIVALGLSDSRRKSILGAGLEEYRRILSASLYTFGLLAILSYLAHASVSRLFFVMTLPLGIALLVAGRAAVRSRLKSARRRGGALARTMVIGAQQDVVHVSADLEKHKNAGFTPVAACVTDAPETFDGDLELVQYAEIADRVERGDIDTIVVAGGVPTDEVRRLAWQCENSNTQLLLTPRLTDVAAPRLSFRQAAGVGLIHVDLPSYSGMKFWAKRIFDIAFSAATLVAIWPVLAVVAIAVKIDSPGPVIFRQQRIGVDGKPFTIHKFRTMCIDAEERIQALIDEAGGKALRFKMENDPRITRVGRVLRKYSLDELPQFWTALRGGMSVVGPRPQVAREVAEYTADAHRRLLIKPGITGLWQVKGRSLLTEEESIRLDLRYVENWTLTGDIAIIAQTVGVVLKPGDQAH